MTAVTHPEVLVGPRGRVAGRERNTRRRLPAAHSSDPLPTLPPGQQARPQPQRWPQTLASRQAVLAMGEALPRGSHNMRSGLVRVLDWLEQQPGESWQQRWRASGAEQAGADWIALVQGTGPRGGSAPSALRAAMPVLLAGQILRPSMEWLLDQHFYMTWPLSFAAIDPDGLAALERHYLTSGRQPGDPFATVRNTIAKLLVHKGGPLTAITAGDCAEYWWARRAHGKTMRDGGLFYTLLFEMGIFGQDAPPNLTAATRPGQLGCAALIDRYQIACTPIRDLLVDYLNVRRPSVDYNSLRHLALNLGKLFWRDLELHHPGIDSLHLAPEVAEAWKQRLRTVRYDRGRRSRARRAPEPILMQVRSFYADLAVWAAEDPARWGRFAAPCPIRPAETSFTKLRKHRKAAMDQRTRTLAPVLPTLVRVVGDALEQARARLEAAKAAGDGERFVVAGVAYRRKDPCTGSGRLFAVEEATGQRVDLSGLEERAFWTWAVVEVLRHTGIRIEEMLELSQYSFSAYTLPSTGEVVPMLQIVPSKTDAERLLLVSPELGEVLTAIIWRVRGQRATLPLVSSWDRFERCWSPRLPLLFQRPVGGVHTPITQRFVSDALDRAMIATGLTDAAGIPLRFTPHDFRRIFTTDALRAGLPPHIAAKILGHADLNTTLGYATVYPEDVISHHRAFIARRRSLRPSEEYRDLSADEWEQFLGHFELRKVELGVCTRDFGTPCVHEHACIRCPVLRPDPAQQPRLQAILANLRDRLREAHEQGWRGEVAGLEVSITAAEQKLQAMQQLAARHRVTHLGMPDFRSSIGRST